MFTRPLCRWNTYYFGVDWMNRVSRYVDLDVPIASFCKLLTLLDYVTCRCNVGLHCQILFENLQVKLSQVLTENV